MQIWRQSEAKHCAKTCRIKYTDFLKETVLWYLHLSKKSYKNGTAWIKNVAVKKKATFDQNFFETMHKFAQFNFDEIFCAIR